MNTVDVALAVMLASFGARASTRCETSFRELEAVEVGLGPARLQLIIAFRVLGRKGLAWVVKRDCHATAVRVQIVPVSAGLTVEDKAIANECADDTTGGE
jgi:hypothetical protein